MIEPTIDPFVDGKRALGVAIKGDSTPSGQRHVSFLYNSFDGVKQLHLGWHKDLRCHAWRGDYVCYEFQGIHQLVQETIAENLEAMAVANIGQEGVISYSGVYKDELDYFDAELKYVDHGVGEGLTCATFVIAVLKVLGIQLLSTDSWPQRRLADMKWLEKILAAMESLVERFPNISQHIAKQRKYKLLMRRFRPEEVAASTHLYKDTPLLFKAVEPLSKKVLTHLAKPM